MIVWVLPLRLGYNTAGIFMFFNNDSRATWKYVSYYETGVKKIVFPIFFTFLFINKEPNLIVYSVYYIFRFILKLKLDILSFE